MSTSSSEQLYCSWYIFTLGAALLMDHLMRAESAVTSETQTGLSFSGWPLGVAFEVPVISERRDLGCPVPLFMWGSWTIDSSTEAVDSPATLAAIHVNVPKSFDVVMVITSVPLPYTTIREELPRRRSSGATQWIVGVGSPVASHLKLAVWPSRTNILCVCCVIRGCSHINSSSLMVQK